MSVTELPADLPPRPRRNKLRTVRLVVAAVVALAAPALYGVARLAAQEAPPAPLPLPYRFLPSPNQDDRPPGATVNCVVVHATVIPTVEGTVRAFTRLASQVSAHFVVGKDGQVIQMVPVERRAWHAGVSDLGGEASVNAFSVGIEMVNLNDGKDPYPDAQIEAVAGIIRFLRSRYTIPDERIVSHAEIARPVGRKSDPLGFDFDRLRELCREK